MTDRATPLSGKFSPANASVFLQCALEVGDITQRVPVALFFNHHSIFTARTGTAGEAAEQ